MTRPFGVTGLSLFFFAGAILAGTAAVSLALPGGVLEPMWSLNPRGHEGLAGVHGWGVLLLAAASVACGTAGVGMWRCRPWGHATALVLLVVQLGGDILNVVSGVEPRAIIGVPIVVALLVYLTRSNVRSVFRTQTTELVRSRGCRTRG